MQKGKKAVWFGLAVLLIIAGIAGIRATDRQELESEVRADASVVSGETWRASFSAELAGDAAESGALKVTDEGGNPVGAEMELSGGRLEVDGLKPGRYFLHVSEDAFGKRSQRGEETIPFSVRENIAPVGSLEELEEHFRQVAERQEREMELYRGEVMVEESAASEDSAAGSDGGDGHSMTNNQVSGIDEGDIVKTDGNYLYVTSDGTLVKIYDIRNEGKPEHIATLEGEDGFQPLELYLSGDILAVIGHLYQGTGGNPNGTADIMPVENSAVGVRLYDVGNPADPKLVREAGNEGWHVSSRLSGNILYLISSMTPIYRIMEQEGDVRPYEYDTARSDGARPMDTDSITILPGPAGDSYTIISAIDLGSGADASIETEGFIGSGGGVYMSKENLYLASSEYQAELFAEGGLDGASGSYTKIFKYAVEGTDVTFAASGEVPGTPLNQFSMDEYDGHFRIAVTDGNMWDDRRPSESAVYVLDRELKETGSVTGLAKGERIYSARFIGDRAYVVTFRETDPLFAIDLSDPAAPAVLGELKIPGFSNYLHPIGDRHLIGFGQETVTVKGEGPEPQVLTAGMKISLFDVSDMTAPKEVAVEVIGGRGTYSELQYDHKALFEHSELGLYGFPVDLYEGTSESEEVRYSGSGAMIYEITPENGIRLQGNLISEDGVVQGYPDYEKRIIRIVYSGNTVYTVSPGEVAAYSIDGFRPLGTSSE